MEHIRYNISSTEDLLSSYQTPSKYLHRILSDVINHPYPPVPTKLPISQKLFEFTLRPELPFTIVCVYLALIAILNKRQDGKNRMKGPWWKAVLLMHNIILAVSKPIAQTNPVSRVEFKKKLYNRMNG
jgi:hypothetical protein